MSDTPTTTGATDFAPAVSIVPGVSILGVLSNLNYEPWYALAEYVDNAIQSASRSYARLRQLDPNYQLNVDIVYDEHQGGRIEIVDNAGGIARRDFDRAFKAAEVPPDRTGLSEFGMGMKSASIWFAKNWRVVTTSAGDPNIYSIEFDMQAVLQDKVERLDVTAAAADVDSHFTRIELWNLNQFLRGRTLGKVRDHLREIYRAFLRDDTLVLSVAGQNMEFIEPDVLRAPDYRTTSADGDSDVALEWHKHIDLHLDEGVRIKGWAAIRAEGRTNSNGLSLFRRRRVIVGTGDTPYRPARIYGQGNSYRSQRLFGELEVEGLPVSHTKDGFQWQGLEEEFHEKLREALDEEPLPLLKQAEHYRARQASRAELRRIRAATENTAEVAEHSIPPVLHQVVEEAATPAPPTQVSARPDTTSHDVTQTFTFQHDDRAWTVTITAGSRASEKDWLVRHVDIEAGSGNVTAQLLLNTGHPFLKQFALGSSDALEAVFRVAVAMVVTESLQTTAGDGESAAKFMRQVNLLLGAALSKRLRSDP
ncbi:ATP-binding protein [Microbacterium sp. NPDC057659]|uniref:ATP-binding protein n=1 Tax=Microbacterium sp. NPDC057659 TaxID=3346198 RepID=UPI0036724A12